MSTLTTEILFTTSWKYVNSKRHGTQYLQAVRRCVVDTCMLQEYPEGLGRSRTEARHKKVKIHLSQTIKIEYISHFNIQISTRVLLGFCQKSETGNMPNGVYSVDILSKKVDTSFLFKNNNRITATKNNCPHSRRTHNLKEGLKIIHMYEQIWIHFVTLKR